jgi:hypothetical protein
MAKYKNNTGGVSRIGYLAKVDTNDKNAFIYATVNDTNILGVITETVPYRSLCDVVNGGNVVVFISGNCVKGDLIRSRKASDGVTNGTSVKVKISDTSYLQIGTALNSGKGLVLCQINIFYQGAASGSSSSQEAFETVSKNLKSFPYVITYNGSDIDYITYTTDTGTIVKTFNYTLGVLTSLTLSGATPSGISLTKTFHYSGSILTSFTYS